MTLTEAAADPLATMPKNKRAYVIPDLKLLYVSMAKNACTSLKWLMAELAGEDLARFRPGLGNATTPEEAIHNRARWQRTPRLGDLDPALRAQIHPDNGWFVFAVVRDPRVRVFSAWENKFLLHNPKYAGLSDRSWFPRPPASAETVIEDFAKFVAMLESSPADRLHKDSHFSTQKRLLVERVVPYSRIYDIAELGELQSHLSAHLAEQGCAVPVRLRHSNDTPLAANAAVFGGGVREAIERIYAADFERFGHHWDFAKVEARPEWSTEALRHAQAVVAMDERICELREIAARALQQKRALEKRVSRLEAKPRRAPRPAPSLTTRVKRRAKRELRSLLGR